MKILKFNESKDIDLIDKFIQTVRETCIRNNIEFRLEDKTHIEYLTGELVNGYFVEYPKPILACATKKDLKDWTGILAHESSHMDQYIEKCPAWINNFIGKKESCEFINEWCNGIELSSKEINIYIEKSINVELDCEKRTVEKIKEYNLPLSVDEYVKNANAYILFYLVVKKYRKWYIPGKEPYRIKEILDLMSPKFDMNYKVMNRDLEKSFIKYCF